MTREIALRKGWCPGARRPMQAKDGLLVRLRISGGVVSAATLRGLAQAGRAHGNGLFDLSARANLQMRGVRDGSLPLLIETLEGLGLLDENAAAEAVRNLLVSPLAGLDGRDDVSSAAKALEAALVANKDLHALPAKFRFLIDGGSALSLGCVPADIRFDWTGGKQPFAIGIGGHANEATFLGLCWGDDIPDIASRLARAFLRLGSQMAERPRRMRGLIESCGAGAIAGLVGLRPGPPRTSGAIEEPCPVGLLRFNGMNCFGAGAAFGRLDANMLDAAARAAEAMGTGEIRLTPWRSLIVPFVHAEEADAMRAYFTAHGFIVNHEDARLAIAACGGASTCESGTTDTRSDALALMPVARQFCKTGVALHVSGCAKGCARQAATPFTLIAYAGRYELVVDVTAIDAGTNDAKRLDLAAVRETLETMARNAGPAERAGEAMTEASSRFNYLRDGAEIYRRSFATIRAEADLARFSRAEELVAVRMIHACGMVQIAAGLVFAHGAVAQARRALWRGAPILCDSKMLARGIIAARLPCANEVICTLDAPSVPLLAQKLGTTRSAAALELWRDRLDGAIAAIGNAPTALFHLLDMLDETSARPACIVGMPVGFVGATESKEALIADARVPFITLKGRKGGSAMAAAALNAIASDAE